MRQQGFGAIAGTLVTETFDYDGGRQVTAYVPPDPPEAIVFAGDGQLITQWGGLLEAADLPPTMVVGAHRVADETLRLHEYSPGFDPKRFAAHERFFVEHLRAWAQSRFGVTLSANRTAVFGVSAGGEHALAIGLRHPDLYGAILSCSPGAGYRPPDVMPNPLPRTYLVAGTLEPFFLDNAARWAAALRDAGADVVMSERAAGHDDAMWRQEFPLMVAWAFGGRSDYDIRRPSTRRSVGELQALGHPCSLPMTDLGDNEAAKPNPALEPLSILIGTWNTTGTHPLVPGKTFHGRTSFTWTEGGAFLLMHSEIDEPEIPSAIAIFGTDDATSECSMLYFDERGVSRRYETSVRDNEWRWWRNAPGFSQRMVATIAADGRTIVSRGELSRDGSHWEPDLALTYTRVG